MFCVISLVATLLLAANQRATADISTSDNVTPIMTVYKTPTCGCCEKWVRHINGAGFGVKSIDLNDLSLVKRRHGVEGQYRSCHTGVVTTGFGDYVFEGHVPQISESISKQSARGCCRLVGARNAAG